jgi:hypothetical protein
VEIGKASLRVKHGPMPIRRGKRFSFDRLAEIGIRERNMGGSSFISRTVWDVMCIDRDGKKQCLIGDVGSPDDAEWLKAELLNRTRGLAS